MSTRRPDIPRPLERAVRVEAGHRCAIPTCRSTSSLQVHHIVDWAIVQEHAFENLILLCANCHGRITAGEIDRASVLAYKANLSLLTGRYGDLERRILERFVKQPDQTEVVVDTSHAVLLDYLISDGLLVYLGPAEGAIWVGEADAPPEESISPTQHYGHATWGLTDEGRSVVERIRNARQLE